MHQNQQMSHLYPNIQYLCQCLLKFAYCWIPCYLILRRYADRTSWWKYKFGQKLHRLRGWRRPCAPHCTSSRIQMENERMRDEPEYGIVVRVGECRQWGNGHRSNVGGGWGRRKNLCWFFLWPDCIYDRSTLPFVFSVLASHPSFLSRVGCLMSVGEKWEWKAKQHNYWTEMPSDCFVMDCLPTLGHRLPARLIQLLCRLDYCPTQNTCPWDMLCVTFLLWVSIGYVLYINPVDVTVLASVMSQRYVRS